MSLGRANQRALALTDRASPHRASSRHRRAAARSAVREPKRGWFAIAGVSAVSLRGELRGGGRGTAAPGKPLASGGPTQAQRLRRRWVGFAATIAAALGFTGLQILISVGNARPRARETASPRSVGVASIAAIRPASPSGVAPPEELPPSTGPAAPSSPLARAGVREKPLHPVHPRVDRSAAALEVARAAPRAAGLTPELRAILERAAASDDPEVAHAARADLAAAWAEEGYRRKRANDLDGAERAFVAARDGGFDRIRASFEVAYLAHQLGDLAGARAALADAAAGPDTTARERALSELRLSYLDEAFHLRARNDPGGAQLALTAARKAGADPQRIDLELAYVSLASRQTGAARTYLAAAAAGPDPVLARQARAQLGVLPARDWLDLYGEVASMQQLGGATAAGALAPMARLRGHHALLDDGTLSAFAAGEVRQGLGWSGVVGAPAQGTTVTAFGAGAMFALLDRRVGVLAQVGPALVQGPAGGNTVLDLRAGAFADTQTSQCWPTARSGATLVFIPCAEVYAEATYLSRVDHDLFTFGRGRAAAAWAITGPVAWELLAEARAARDLKALAGATFAAAGAGPRLRLVRPVHLDLIATAGASATPGGVVRPELRLDLVLSARMSP